MTDQEKQHIKEEEIYREEIRKNLQDKGKGKAWTFLNSSFGIWLLSTIFVTGLTLAISSIQTKKSEVRAAKVKTKKIDLEMGDVLTKFRAVLSQIQDTSENIFYDRVSSTLSSFHVYTIPLFEENKMKSVPSLLLDLEEVADEMDLPLIDTALNTSLKYQTIEALINRQTSRKELWSYVERFRKDVTTVFSLPRWSN